MWRLLLAGATLALLTGASGGPSLRAHVSPAPATFAGPAWRPTIALTAGGRPAAATLKLTIRRAGVARTFVPRAARRGSYRVTVRFPSAGRWAWSVAAGRRTLARGAITVTALFRFELPYDLAVEPGGTILFPDRGRVLAWNPTTRRVSVRAVTPSDELVALVRHADGTLYGADLPGHRILRIDAAGHVSTAAQLRAPGDLVLHPDGSTLWAGSLEDGVYRVDLATGRATLVVHARSPHGVDRAPDGTIYYQDGQVVRRLAPDGTRALVADVNAIKLLAAADSVYGVVGEPSGGRVVRIEPGGKVVDVAGTGDLGPHRDGRALGARILPSAVQLTPDGSLLVAQVRPVPAIRRVDLAAGTIETLVRGR
jgi:sugar lactone lactonase YvrE